MRTTNEVLRAVRDGDPCTEEELRYAVQSLGLWVSKASAAMADALTRMPHGPSADRLQHAWDSRKTFTMPLDQQLQGTEHEPGISHDVRINRMAAAAAKASTSFVQGLLALQRKDP